MQKLFHARPCKTLKDEQPVAVLHVVHLVLDGREGTSRYGL